MPATLETIKSEEKQTYHYPLKTNYREHIHSPEGVNGPVEHSMLMDMLKKVVPFWRKIFLLLPLTSARVLEARSVRDS